MLFIILVGCSGQSYEAASDQESQTTQAAARGDLSIFTGQVLYVPAYSEVYSATEDQTWDMTVTLSIRNANLDKSIFINSVQYYDTNGKLVTDYVESP